MIRFVGVRRTKRDFSTAQTATFAGAKVEEKASVCFGRNDKFAAMLRFAAMLANHRFAAKLADRSFAYAGE